MAGLRKGLEMGRRHHTVEQIIRKLREAEVELAQGSKTPQVCRKLEISERTYYRWRMEYGGLRVNEARRLKELEHENARLRRPLAQPSGNGSALPTDAASRPRVLS